MGRMRFLLSVTIVWTIGLFVADLSVPFFLNMPSAEAAGKRWAQFDLANLNDAGAAKAGEDLSFSMTLGGFPLTDDPVMAIVESPTFYNETVPLVPESTSRVYKGVVALEPTTAAKSRTSVVPKAVHIRVTFAVARKKGLIEFMVRDLYVTLDQQEATQDLPDEPPQTLDDNEPRPEPEPEETPPGQESVSVSEEDLMPGPIVKDTRTYWQQVSHLISRSWNRQVRDIRQAPSGETVRIGFRIFGSGQAQLIQIERGSGARDLDEAGVLAILQAHPFPPLPSELSEEPVDVHVRLRTGPRPKPRERLSREENRTDPTSAPSGTGRADSSRKGTGIENQH